MTPPPYRFWTAPDGREYRVVLQPPARHRIRQGETRPTLTFVDLEGTSGTQVHRQVPEGTVLGELGDDDLTSHLGGSDHAR